MADMVYVDQNCNPPEDFSIDLYLPVEFRSFENMPYLDQETSEILDSFNYSNHLNRPLDLEEDHSKHSTEIYHQSTTCTTPREHSPVPDEASKICQNGKHNTHRQKNQNDVYNFATFIMHIIEDYIPEIKEYSVLLEEIIKEIKSTNLLKRNSKYKSSVEKSRFNKDYQTIIEFLIFPSSSKTNTELRSLSKDTDLSLSNKIRETLYNHIRYLLANESQIEKYKNRSKVGKKSRTSDSDKKMINNPTTEADKKFKEMVIRQSEKLKKPQQYKKRNKNLYIADEGWVKEILEHQDSPEFKSMMFNDDFNYIQPDLQKKVHLQE